MKNNSIYFFSRAPPCRDNDDSKPAESNNLQFERSLGVSLPVESGEVTQIVIQNGPN